MKVQERKEKTKKLKVQARRKGGSQDMKFKEVIEGTKTKVKRSRKELRHKS